MSSLYFNAYLATVAAKSAASYYIYGPRLPSWSLKFQVRRDVMHSVIKNRVAPLDEKDIDKLDVQKLTDSNRANDLPLTELSPELGVFRASTIPVAEVDIDTTVFAGTGPAEQKLCELVEDDKKEPGKQRGIPYEVIVPNSALATLNEHVSDEDGMFSCTPLYDGESVILYLHGGSYIVGSPASHRGVLGRISDKSGLRVFSIDYRLAPLHPFPAQLHDAYIAFMYLAKQGFKPENIVIAGDSAGGNLSLVLTHLLRHTGISSIRGLVLLSPWVDLAVVNRPSLTENAPFDYLAGSGLESPNAAARLFYAPGRKHSEGLLEELAHHLVSPINGDFVGFPPTLIQAGDRELLVDDIVEMHRNITEANPGQREKYIYEGYKDMIHVFHQFIDTPEALAAIASIGKFIRDL